MLVQQRVKDIEVPGTRSVLAQLETTGNRRVKSLSPKSIDFGPQNSQVNQPVFSGQSASFVVRSWLFPVQSACV